MFSGFSKNRDFLSTGYDTFCEYGLKKRVQKAEDTQKKRSKYPCVSQV